MVESMYDVIRLGAFAVAVIVLAFQTTKRFLLVDTLFNMSFAVMLVVKPSIFDSQVTQPMDSMHYYLAQAAGCFDLLYVCFYFFFVRPAKDDDAAHGLLACRTLALGLSTIVSAFSWWRSPGLFKDNMFPTILLISVLWSCLAAYHLYLSGIHTPRRGRISPINFYIKIDIVLALLLSVPDLLFASYNKQFVSMDLDKLHEHEIIGLAAVHLSTAVLGVYAIGFRNITERKGYLCCRVTALLLITACLGYTIMFRKMTLTRMDLAFNLLISVPVIPATIGLLLTSDRRSFSSGAGGYNLRARRS